MPHLDPDLMRVVIDLERGLRELGMRFAVVGALVPELLLDARPYLDEPLSNAVQAVLDRFDSPDATAVDIAARETGRFLADDEERLEIFQRFRWYRLGIGL